MADFKVFVGVDWATQTHQVCALDEKGDVIRERAFEHSGAGLAQMADWIAEAGGGSPSEVGVGIEVPRGTVVETLLERGFVVHAINPKQMDRFRDRHSVSGAKDDRRDARVIASALRTDPKDFRRVVVDEPAIIELRAWSRISEELTTERVRLGNQVQDEFRRYFPQLLKITDDVTAEWFLRLWEYVKTPELAKKVHVNVIARLLKRHHVKRPAKEMLDELRTQPVVLVAGATNAAVVHVEQLVARLLLVLEQHKQAVKKLDALCKALATPEEASPGQKSEHRDAEILQSLPGVGRIVLATMLAEASEPLKRRDYHALRALSGVAPITMQSGRHRSVSMRYACSQRLRNALFYWARSAINTDPASRTQYDALRARGKNHARALRTVGDRLLSVAWYHLARAPETCCLRSGLLARARRIHGHQGRTGSRNAGGERAAVQRRGEARGDRVRERTPRSRRWVHGDR